MSYYEWSKVDENYKQKVGDILLLQSTKDQSYLVEMVGSRYRLPNNFVKIAFTRYVSETINLNSIDFKPDYILKDLNKPIDQKVDRLDVTHYMKVNLILGGKVHNVYSRKSDSSRNTDHIAEALFQFDRKFSGGSSTYSDRCLNELSKLGFKSKSGKSFLDYIQDYWIESNYVQLVDKEYNKYFESVLEDSKDLDQLNKDFRKGIVYSYVTDTIDNLRLSPKFVFLGFLYWFKKFILSDKPNIFDNIENEVPKMIKELVDNSYKLGDGNNG